MTTGDVRLSSTAVPILGYGYYRRHIGEPWFSATEYIEYMPRKGLKKTAASRAGFHTIVKGFSELGLIDQVVDDRPQRVGLGFKHRITNEGVDVMLDEVARKVTTSTDTVPGVLMEPGIAEIILEETDLKERIIAEVSKLAVWQEYAGYEPITPTQ